MKTDAKYKPEGCVSVSSMRSHLGSVHLNIEKKRLEATNGHMLVVVPTEPEDGDTSGLVPPEAFKAARKLASNKAADISFKASEKVQLQNNATYSRETAQFPPIDQVIPSYKQGTKGTLTVGFNVKYLLALAEALGANKKAPVIHLTIQLPAKGAEMLDPYVVTTSDYESGAFGILMPTRVK